MSLMLPILLAAANVVTTNAVPTNATTRITAGSTYYDRKEGFVLFKGNVAVIDPQYQLHADRAFVYTGATNDLRKIVALGHVAITNETKRAYGARASYYRGSGMVVLHSGDGIVAEVRDVTPDGDRVVRGKKIKFWTGTRQVEVVEAEITSPTTGLSDQMKGMFGR